MADKQKTDQKCDWGLITPGEARYDLISLGSLIHRIDPGNQSWAETRSALIHVSGAEYNVAANTHRYGLKTAVVTRTADYSIGELVRGHVQDVGVDILEDKPMEHTPWSGTHAAVYSRTPRGKSPNRIDYIRCAETGATIQPGDLDYDKIFDGGVSWVHSGGLYTALADHTPDLIIEFFKAAKKRGAVVSFDLNYRKKLWKYHGGQEKCIESMKRIVPYVDVLFGNETDIADALGITASAKKSSPIDPRPFIEVQEKVRGEYKNLKIIVTSLRHELSNAVHKWGAVASIGGKIYQVEARDIPIECRIGGGDGLAGGFITSIFKGLSYQDALDNGWASGALVASVRGDITKSSWDDVLTVAKEVKKGEQTSGSRVDR